MKSKHEENNYAFIDGANIKTPIFFTRSRFCKKAPDADETA
ncbi:MAG: hypothetical protein AAB362_02015 [Patescibacteria group bacterium]